MKLWSYEELKSSSDLVAICKFISSVDAPNDGILPNSPTNWSVVGVTSVLEVRAVLKGDMNLKNILLHHYRMQNADETLDNGPTFVKFDPKAKGCFLLFVKKENDGRYSPTSGQIDPALFSVIKLDSLAK